MAAHDTPYERGTVIDHIEYGRRSDTLFTVRRCLHPDVLKVTAADATLSGRRTPCRARSS
ncbi:hypothetical protein ACFVH0_15835 [Streptomyces sp. NPDC127117]|uniref:hypothetical protein n=1 Tax=Streptomyces sp. NPDC127117 TaxID=3345368 RepID=UPI003627FAE8